MSASQKYAKHLNIPKKCATFAPKQSNLVTEQNISAHNSRGITLFITSSPSVSMDGALNPANGFQSELLKACGDEVRCLFVSSNAESASYSDHCGLSMKVALEDAGMRFASYEILDRRTAPKAQELVEQSNLLILGGGHVPTMHSFLLEVYLKQLLRRFSGVVMGISAGSMNCADIVYAWPEMEGESIDPSYQRFFPGLGLTPCSILPHYHMMKGGKLDGKLVFEEIAYPDSMGHRFYVFPDGTYIYGHDGMEEIRGEAYIIENGIFRQISRDGERVMLPVI